MAIGFLFRKVVPDIASSRFRRSERVLAARQGDEAVLFDTAGEQYFTLTDVGACVWTLLEQPSTLADLVAAVCRDYDVPGADPVARVSSDVTDLLSQLHGAGLIVAESIVAGRS